jgi:hypothetical protein
MSARANPAPSGARTLRINRHKAKTPKDGRVVLITSVVFDADVFNESCKYITRDDGQRSDVINKAVRDSLATPGWIESAHADPFEPRAIAFTRTPKPPSSVCPKCAGRMKWRKIALTQNAIREGLARGPPRRKKAPWGQLSLPFPKMHRR